MECVELWDRGNDAVNHSVTLVHPWESLLWASRSMHAQKMPLKEGPERVLHAEREKPRWGSSKGDGEEWLWAGLAAAGYSTQLLFVCNVYVLTWFT